MEDGNGSKIDSDKEITFSDPPRSLGEFMDKGAAKISSTDLPIPRALRAIAERMQERTKDSKVIERATVLMRLVHAEQAQRLIDPKLHTADSTLKTVQQLKNQRDLSHYQTLVFREWLKELPESKREQLLTTAYFLHSLPNLLEDPRNIEGVIESIDMLTDFLENHTPDTGESNEIKSCYPPAFIEFISTLKYLNFKIQDDNYKFSESKARAHLVMRKGILRDLLPQISDESQREKTEEVLGRLDEIKEGDVRTLIKAYVAELSELPIYNLVMHFKSSKRNLDIVEDIPARLRSWKKSLQAAQSDDDLIYRESTAGSVAEEMKVITDNYELLGRSLNERFIKLIPKEIPPELRDLLTGIIKYAADMLTVLGRVQQQNDEKGSKARFGKDLAPVYAQLKLNYEKLFRRIEKAADKVDSSDLNLDSLEFDSSSEIKPQDIAIAAIDQKPDEGPSEEPSKEVDPKQLFDTDEISAVLEDPSQEDLLPGRVADFLNESCMNMGQALKEDIGRYLSMALSEKYGEDLGSELSKCTTALKRTLRRVLVTMAKIFNEDVYMTDVFPEMREEIKSHRTLRTKVLDFNEEMAVEMAGFSPENGANLAKALTMFQNLLNLMKEHDCLTALFLEDDSIQWEAMKSSLDKMLGDQTQHRRFLIKVLAQKVSDFMISISGTLPGNINNRELLIIHDKDRVLRAGLKISTAKALLFAEQSDEDLLALLTSAGGDLLGCRDRNRNAVDEFMGEIEDLIEFIEKLDEEDRHLLDSMFLQLETKIKALIAVLQL